MALYNVLNTGFSFILSLFYDRIDVRGLENIPHDGPIVFCGNHGNGLIDPLLVMCMTDRHMSTIVKSTLFDIPVLSAILRVLKAVPVRRRQDFKNATQDNTAALDAMSSILTRGDCLIIFPEGVSHDLPEIHELKTGFARAAVAAVRTVDKEDFRVYVIPVGLNFANKDRFRSDVFVDFGKPIVVDKNTVYGDQEGKGGEAKEEKERKYTHWLAETVKGQLESVALVADSWETLRVLTLGRDLYLDQGDPLSNTEVIEYTHRFVTSYQKAKQEKEVADVFREVELYLSQLDLLRISDKIVAEASQSPPLVLAHVMKVLGFYLFTLPVSLPGSIIHGPLGIVCKYLARYLSRTPDKGLDRDQIAHFKIMSAIVLLPVYYTLLGVAVWRWIGGAFVAPILFCTFLSGYMAIQTRPIYFTFKSLGFVTKFLFTDFKSLIKTRKYLRGRVKQVIDKFKDKYAN